MQTSARLRDPGGGYRDRRGHGQQLSISDDNHHVTEAIGDMYGDSDYPPPKRDSRPLSFISSPLNGTIEQGTNAHYESTKGGAGRSALGRTMSNERTSPTTTSPSSMMPHRASSMGRETGATSPVRSPMRDQSPSETARTQFPLNDVDYESDPAAVQQELSNLQALRRMSMDVNSAGDPDLPAYAGSMMPAISPSASSDEDDESRLFWVPARLHPELAPTEFKTFLENRVDQIKRRSGGESSLSAESPSRQNSGSSLRRKKSMLSRQIDNSGGRAADGYEDGAERLEKKRSISGQHRPDLKVSDFEDLDDVVKDPRKLMRKLSIDTGIRNQGNGHDEPAEDLPILPIAPLGNSLRRSTRTAYRRGSLRKGENVGLSKRRAGVPKAAETDTEESPKSPSPTGPGFNGLSSLSRVQTEPIPSIPDEIVENFSRPSRSQRGRAIPPGTSSTASFDDILKQDEQARTGPAPTSFQQRVLQEKELAKSDRYSAPHILTEYSVPQIIETPPPPEDDDSVSSQAVQQQTQLPERTSSYDPPSSHPPQGPLPHGPGSSRSGKRSAIIRPGQSRKNDQTLNDIVGQPSPLPGNSTRTDSLSFIPTFSEDKKGEKKKEKKEKDGGDGPPRKSSWGWFTGNGEKHQHKDKDSGKDKDAIKKAIAKTSKANDKSHDNTRLDLLQTSIDGGRGRESLVLDRDGLKFEDERRKDGSRKSSGGDKPKESGLFSFFGGKKKGDKDSARSRNSRGLSPDPPQRVQRPDLDYNWTRFPLIEERAIYRMAHIKLANPRRALYSQVLLSNFMYSYLDKVQAMHPQLSTAQQAAQKQNRSSSPQQQANGQDGEQQESQYYQKHEPWVAKAIV